MHVQSWKCGHCHHVNMASARTDSGAADLELKQPYKTKKLLEGG